MRDDTQRSRHELPIACTLSGAEQVAGRAEAARTLFARCRRVSELEDGYTFEFPENDRAESLMRYIAAERECCKFLAFELVFEPDRGPIYLRMRGPRGTREFIRANMDEEFVRRHGLEDRG